MTRYAIHTADDGSYGELCMWFHATDWSNVADIVADIVSEWHQHEVDQDLESCYIHYNIRQVPTGMKLPARRDLPCLVEYEPKEEAYNTYEMHPDPDCPGGDKHSWVEARADRYGASGGLVEDLKCTKCMATMVTDHNHTDRQDGTQNHYWAKISIPDDQGPRCIECHQEATAGPGEAICWKCELKADSA